MNIPYQIDFYDNLVQDSARDAVYQYVREQRWYGYWAPVRDEIFHYKLTEGTDWFKNQSILRHSGLHRSCLASDEESLKVNHLPVYILWKELNRQLGNQFELTGYPEGMKDKSAIAPPTTNPSLKPGWRVYVNAMHNNSIVSNGHAHRDTPIEENDDSTVTMLYVLNKEWYPNWGADIRFYPEDPEGIAGDHQQFSFDYQQSRGYNVGWLDQGRIVSPVPGRLIVYDGRCLHATSQAGTGLDNPSVKLAFRARRINTK